MNKKEAWFLVKAVLLSAGLPVLAIAAWAFCVDWRGPADDLSQRDRAHAEDCFSARRELGDRALRDRPDCRDVLSPPAAGKTVEERR